MMKNEKGITLTEVVIYIGVVSVVTFVVLAMIVQLIQLKTYSNSVSTVATEARNVLDKMVKDVRECDSFSVVDSSTLQIVKDGNTSTYTLAGTSITYTKGIETSNLTTNQVQVNGLIFEDWTSINSDNLIHIEMNISRGEVNENYQTSVHTR